MNKAAWMVDMGYVVKASEKRFKLEYVAAEELLRELYGPIRTFLFNSFDVAYGIDRRLQSFYDAMKAHGMQLRLHPMQSGGTGPFKGNRQRRVDVDFSAHMVWQASQPKIETIVITTGDQDFIPAVNMVRTMYSKQVVLFAYSGTAHHELLAAASDFLSMDAERARIERIT